MRSLPPLDLRGPRLKVDRAKEHIREAYGIAKAYRDSNPYVPDTEFDPEAGKKSLGIKLTRDVPERAFLVIGDAIHNLQVALDYLACNLARQHGTIDLDKVYFPIRASANGFAKHLAEREMQERFGENALTFFKKVEPYDGGDGRLLNVVRMLDRSEKHREMVALGNVPFGINITHTSADAAEFRPANRLFLNKHATFVIEPANAESQYDLKVSVNIAFADIELFPEAEPVFPLLEALFNAVAKVINLAVNTFETI